MTALVLFVVFFALLIAGVPIAFVLGIAPIPYLLAKGDVGLAVVPIKLFTGLESFLLVSLPFFMLASSLMNAGGITRRLVLFVGYVLGHIRGGLAHVNVGVSMLFAGITGMATADTAAIGGILIPAMIEEGYDDDFACAVTVASSCIGPIIPPSFIMVLYSLVAGGVSVGALFLAGVVPGILMGLLQMALIAYYAAKRNYPRQVRRTPMEVLRAAVIVAPAVLLPVTLVGGIVSGVFTTTEAANVAVFVGFLIAVFFYKDLKLRELPKMFVETGVLIGTVLFILGGASLFAWVLTVEMIPQLVAAKLLAITSSKAVLVLLLALFLLVVGTFMDPTPAMLILAPVLLPVAVKAGMDPIQFGVFMALALVIGLITPPVGTCLFIASAISKLPLHRVIRALPPFLLVNALVVILIGLWKPLTNFIPALFR